MSATDAELLEKWRIASDSEAFHELVLRHGGMVRRTCARILRDPGAADDITQECFIKLWQVKQVRGGSLGGLLHTLATHLSLNRLRAESRRREREIDYATEGAHADTEQWAEVLPFVDEAIADLPEKLRYPVIMHYLEGQAYAAIAQSLTVDESTVRYRVQKALERMRIFLKRRHMAVDAGMLAGILGAEHAAAAVLPEGLRAILGKLAIASESLPLAVPPLAGSITATIGGVVLMWKNVMIGVGILSVAAALFFTFGLPSIRSAKDEAIPEVKATSLETPDDNTTPIANPAEPQQTISPDILKQLMMLAMQQSAQQADLKPVSFKSEDVPTDNGAHYFLLAAELMPGIDIGEFEERWKALKESGNINDPEFLAMLEKFQEAFNAIRMGLEVGNVQMPTPSDWLNASMEHLGSFRHLARAFNIEAEYDALQGDYRTAFENYRTILAFGSESSRGGVLIGGLVGQAIENGAVQSLRESLSYNMATPEEYRYLIQEMSQMDQGMYTISESVMDENNAFGMWLDDIQAAGVDVRSLIPEEATVERGLVDSLTDTQLEAAFRGVLQAEDVMAEYCALPYYEAQAIDLDAYLGTDPNVRALMPAYDRLVAQEANTRTQFRGTMLSAAIESYRAETGAYPGELSSLVPNYVSSLPEDPFSGQPFEYAPTDSSYLLYSTGPDMVSNSGEPMGEEGPFPKREGDIVLHEG